MLEFNNVCYTYHTPNGETRAVENLSFAVEKGQFVSIIGPSGCGKSTILSLAAGLISPTSGSIRRGSNKYGYMLQKDALFPWRTVKENILLPLEIKHQSTPQARERAEALAHKYGLGDFLDKYPYQLSGGMRQRVALIRTLSFDPDLLLLDEPFSALDYQTRLNVCDDVQRIILQEKKTALLVTHDISEAIALSHKVIVLSSRPARALKQHPVTFGKTARERREMPDFAPLFECLREELGL